MIKDNYFWLYSTNKELNKELIKRYDKRKIEDMTLLFNAKISMNNNGKIYNYFFLFSLDLKY